MATTTALGCKLYALAQAPTFVESTMRTIDMHLRGSVLGKPPASGYHRL